MNNRYFKGAMLALAIFLVIYFAVALWTTDDLIENAVGFIGCSAALSFWIARR